MFGLTFSIVPVALMVMGVIYFVNLVSNRDLKKRRQYRFEFARALRQKAGQESDPDKKAGYLLSADYLENQGFSSIASQSIVPTGVKVSSAQSTETPEMVVSPLSSEETIVENKIDTLESSKSVRAQLVSLDNINILFYIGAFLVVVAAGVFVGFNYESISGIGKTMFLAIFALVFYGVGTYLYLKAKNIQQAGLVFVTVGLILAPLVGLAYFKFSAMGTDGHMIWFVTSLIVTALYVVSLLIVKKPFLSYFVTFVSLSLLESSISVFDAPTQYFAWGMAVFSTIFLLVGQIKFRDEYVSSAFRVSANIFLPISIIFSLVFSAFTLESSLLINGTNLIFAAVFYNLSSFLSLQTKHRQGFLAASLLLFPVGIILLLCDKLVAETTIAIVTGGIALIYFVAYELLKKIFDDKRPLLLVFFAGVIPLLSVSLIFDNNAAMIINLIAITIFNAYGFFRERNTICYALTLFSLFLLPPYIYNLAGFWQIQYLAYIYSFLGLMLVLIRVFVSQWESKTKLLTYIAYLLAFLISFGQFVTCGDSLTLSLAAFGLSLVAVGLSYLEDQEYLVVPSIVLFYISVASFVSYAVIISIGSLDLYDPLFSVVFWALAGLVLFGLSYLFKNTRSKCFAYGGLVGPMIGALVGLASDITQSVLPVISLCVGGLLCLGQSFRIRFDIGKYISGGIILTSILWFFHTQWITQAQCYTLPIAAYFSLLAYLRHRKNDSLAKDIFIVLGLIFLTLPTFIQSIAFNDPLYGLILGIESLGLVIAGIAASHKITLRFGIVALVIDVLYQSREFIAEIPKWLIIGLVGLAIMIGATYLLHKSNKGRQ